MGLGTLINQDMRLEQASAKHQQSSHVNEVDSRRGSCVNKVHRWRGFSEAHVSTKFTASRAHMSTKFTDGEASAKVMCQRSSQLARLQQRSCVNEVHSWRGFSKGQRAISQASAKHQPGISKASARHQQSISQASAKHQPGFSKASARIQKFSKKLTQKEHRNGNQRPGN